MLLRDASGVREERDDKLPDQLKRFRIVGLF